MQAVATQERTNLELHNELIKRAEDLIPVLKARSEAANEDRRIPKETIQDFKVVKKSNKLGKMRSAPLKSIF